MRCLAHPCFSGDAGELLGVVKGEKPSRAGGSEKRQRTKLAMIRLTPEERERVEEAASKAGLTLSSYGRTQMLNAAPPRSVRRPPVEKQLLARVLGQLGKAGSNVNQIARFLNFGDEVLSDDVRAAILEIRAAVAAVMQALGRGR